MARESFSNKIKEQLRTEEIKKKCCKYTFSDVMALQNIRNCDISDKLNEIYFKCRCETCKSVFIRAIFVLFGSVTDPEKSYHLDFSVKYPNEREIFHFILAESGFDFHVTMRREKYVLYIKDSSAIEDFLVFIGAQAAAFELMNKKIEREFRNSVNRQVNCDTANIEKQLTSVKKYIEAVQYLIDSGSIEKLSPELRKTAILRLENEQLSMTDLGALVNPPVSKSGMKHRLEKILEFAKEEKQKESPFR